MRAPAVRAAAAVRAGAGATATDGSGDGRGGDGGTAGATIAPRTWALRGSASTATATDAAATTRTVTTAASPSAACSVGAARLASRASGFAPRYAVSCFPSSSRSEVIPGAAARKGLWLPPLAGAGICYSCGLAQVACARESVERVLVSWLE